MKNKRIFAVIPAKNQIILPNRYGTFCVLTYRIYACIYTPRYRLSPFTGSRNASVFDLVLGGTEGGSLLLIHTSNTHQLCQEPRVSGQLKSTVSAILRQQRDSLHRIRNFLSRECLRLATPTTSQPHARFTLSSLMPSGSASRTSATAVSSSPSKPPE